MTDNILEKKIDDTVKAINEMKKLERRDKALQTMELVISALSLIAAIIGFIRGFTVTGAIGIVAAVGWFEVWRIQRKGR